ncbi:unnamed protein product, partial [marine sediment metagenome]
HIIAAPRQQIVDMTNNSTDPLEFTVGGTVYPDWLSVNTTPGTTDMRTAIFCAEASLTGGGSIKGVGSTYLISSSLTINSDIILDLLTKGSKIQDDAGNAALTINGTIEAGFYQIFDWGNGTGSLSINNNTVNPAWFGAHPDATATVNDAAFAESVDALSDYGSWELPEGQYSTDLPITFSALNSMKITFIGRISASTDGLVFDAISLSLITGINLINSAGVDWESGFFGVKFQGSTSGFSNNTVFITNIQAFEKGMYLLSTATKSVIY